MLAYDGHIVKIEASTNNGMVSMEHGPAETSITFEKPEIHAEKKNIPVSYNIAFHGGDNTELSKGYLLDDGAVRLDRSESGELFYGWERPAHAVKCAENRHVSSLDQGGVEFPPDPHNQICYSEDVVRDIIISQK